MRIELEACVGNYVEAMKAMRNGATRIELCDNLGEGGTTPSYGTIKKCIDDIDIPINVIIRPRGGDFIYSKEEFEVMIEDIKLCNKLNVNGIVIGLLSDEKIIDEEGMKELLSYRGNMEVTFHMAFDEIRDKKEAIDKLTDLGIERILTKGGEVSALNNLNQIKELIEYANDRIILMPGGGVNKYNREEVIKSTAAKEVHGTKIV